MVLSVFLFIGNGTIPIIAMLSKRKFCWTNKSFVFETAPQAFSCCSQPLWKWASLPWFGLYRWSLNGRHHRNS